MEPIDVTVLVADDRLNAIGDVAAALERAGLRGGAALPLAGVITGAADPAGLEALRAVEGVTAVEPVQEFQLPPPDAPIQLPPARRVSSSPRLARSTRHARD